MRPTLNLGRFLEENEFLHHEQNHFRRSSWAEFQREVTCGAWNLHTIMIMRSLDFRKQLLGLWTELGSAPIFWDTVSKSLCGQEKMNLQIWSCVIWLWATAFPHWKAVRLLCFYLLWSKEVFNIGTLKLHLLSWDNSIIWELMLM